MIDYEAADEAAMAIWRSDKFLYDQIPADAVRQIGRAAIDAALGDNVLYTVCPECEGGNSSDDPEGGLCFSCIGGTYTQVYPEQEDA